jgi:hypothetical protein
MWPREALTRRRLTNSSMSAGANRNKRGPNRQWVISPASTQRSTVRVETSKIAATRSTSRLGRRESSSEAVVSFCGTSQSWNLARTRRVNGLRLFPLLRLTHPPGLAVLKRRQSCPSAHRRCGAHVNVGPFSNNLAEESPHRGCGPQTSLRRTKGLMVLGISSVSTTRAMSGCRGDVGPKVGAKC